MKKFPSILFLSLIWIIGCGDDDSSASFIGTWIADQVSTENCSDFSRNGTSALACDDVSCYELELRGDKTYTYQKGLATETGTWNVDGLLYLCLDEEGEIICETYDALFSSASMFLTADTTSSGCVSTYRFNLQMETDTTQ